MPIKMDGPIPIPPAWCGYTLSECKYGYTRCQEDFCDVANG